MGKDGGAGGRGVYVLLCGRDGGVRGLRGCSGEGLAAGRRGAIRGGIGQVAAAAEHIGDAAGKTAGAAAAEQRAEQSAEKFHYLTFGSIVFNVHISLPRKEGLKMVILVLLGFCQHSLSSIQQPYKLLMTLMGHR